MCVCARACVCVCVLKGIVHFTNDRFVYVNIVCVLTTGTGKRDLYFSHLPIVFLFVKDIVLRESIVHVFESLVF